MQDYNIDIAGGHGAERLVCWEVWRIAHGARDCGLIVRLRTGRETGHAVRLGDRCENVLRDAYRQTSRLTIKTILTCPFVNRLNQAGLYPYGNFLYISSIQNPIYKVQTKGIP